MERREAPGVRSEAAEEAAVLRVLVGYRLRLLRRDPGQVGDQESAEADERFRERVERASPGELRRTAAELGCGVSLLDRADELERGGA